MKSQIKTISISSFYQLLIVYALLITIAFLGFISRFTFHFEILSIIIAILGFSIIQKNSEKINKKLHLILSIITISAIFIFRAIPYLNNSIPLGYDAGIYKYAIEVSLNNLPNWIITGPTMEPLFLYLMKPLTFIFSTHFILTWLFILFNVLLGISIYYFAKEYFGKRTAIISMLVFAVSTVQFITFTYMYYRNILGIILMLFSLTFLKKSGDKKYRVLFIIFAGLLGAIHRPTFYLFGLSYFFYSILTPISTNKYDVTAPPQTTAFKLWCRREHPKFQNKPHLLRCGETQGICDFKKLKFNIINGVLIIAIFLLFYIGKFWPALSIAGDVAQSYLNPGESPGTFISFFQYQFLTLPYLLFAILGFLYLIKNKKFSILFFWTTINAIIVYFQFFFFNRFIIHLDIALIILSGLGFSLIIENKKKLGYSILFLMLVSSAFLTYSHATDAKPLITNESFFLINKIPYLTEENAVIMSFSKEFSPWILAYSQRTIIAPGLFDENKWNESEWNVFWGTQEKNKTIELMSEYDLTKPVYLFTGIKTFTNPCFTLFLEENSNKLYKYVC